MAVIPQRSTEYLHGHGVEPAATAGAAGGGAVLVAALADVVADVVVLLGRKGPAADARGVGLDDAHEILHRLRRNTRAGVEPQRRAVAAGHVRVRAVIDVQQHGVRAFENDPLPCLAMLAEAGARVIDKRLHPTAEIAVLLENDLSNPAAERRREP